MRAQQLSPFWASVAYPAGAGRLRRQGRPGAGACLAARGASGGALAGVGDDERRDAEDRHLRPAAGELRSGRHAALVVGRGGAGGRPGHGAVRRALQHRAERHEAPAGLFLDREHRPDGGRHRPDADLPCLPHGGAGGAGHDGRALPLPRPCRLQEPAVPVHRLGAARDQGAQPGQARRADPPHALGGVAGPGRRDRQRRPAAAVRLRLRVAAAARLPVLAGPAASLAQHGGAGGGRRRGAGRGAGRLRHGQVLRHHLPRPDARAGAQGRPRCRPLGDASAWSGWP